MSSSRRPRGSRWARRSRSRGRTTACTAFAGEVEVADFTGAVAQYCVRYNDGTGSHWHAAAVVRASSAQSKPSTPPQKKLKPTPTRKPTPPPQKKLKPPSAAESDPPPPPQKSIVKRPAPTSARTITVDVDGDKVELHAAFADAVLKISAVRAQRVRQKFLGTPTERQAIHGRNSHFFRETDRHSMYYVRARQKMIREMRGKDSDDLGPLSNAEAQAVVFTTYLFRLYNRMGTFVLWSLLRKYVTTPDTAKPAKWAAALASLTKEDLDEYHCAQREFSPTRVTLPGFPGLAVAPRAVVAAAVKPSQGVGFLNCVHALKDNGYTVFTGQHQVQSRDNTRSVVETLLRGSYLAELTETLRTIRPTDKKLCMEQCCKALKITHVGEFLQYQIIQDLVEPRNSIFRGQPNEADIRRERFEYAQFGPGSLGGAGLVAAGNKKIFSGAKGQAARGARALASRARWSCTATRSLCADQAGSATSWTCRRRDGSRLPAARASAMKRGDKNKQRKPIEPTCCAPPSAGTCRPSRTFRALIGIHETSPLSRGAHGRGCRRRPQRRVGDEARARTSRASRSRRRSRTRAARWSRRAVRARAPRARPAKSGAQLLVPTAILRFKPSARVALVALRATIDGSPAAPRGPSRRELSLPAPRAAPLEVRPAALVVDAIGIAVGRQRASCTRHCRRARRAGRC